MPRAETLSLRETKSRYNYILRENHIRRVKNDRF
jgi:hypothetical protein